MNKKFSQLGKLKTAPPTVGSDNLKKGEITKTQPENLRFGRNYKQLSQRTIQIATKLTPEIYDLLQKIAYEKRLKLVEVLEEAITLLAKELEIN